MKKFTGTFPSTSSSSNKRRANSLFANIEDLYAIHAPILDDLEVAQDSGPQVEVAPIYINHVGLR